MERREKYYNTSINDFVNDKIAQYSSLAASAIKSNGGQIKKIPHIIIIIQKFI